jgi:hypothetical protein
MKVGRSKVRAGRCGSIDVGRSMGTIPLKKETVKFNVGEAGAGMVQIPRRTFD